MSLLWQQPTDPTALTQPYGDLVRTPNNFFAVFAHGEIMSPVGLILVIPYLSFV